MKKKQTWIEAQASTGYTFPVECTAPSFGELAGFGPMTKQQAMRYAITDWVCDHVHPSRWPKNQYPEQLRVLSGWKGFEEKFVRQFGEDPQRFASDKRNW